MDSLWCYIIFYCITDVRCYMTTIFKGYLLLIALFSSITGLWGMFTPDFNVYPYFEGIERYTLAASFIRTMSGVFVASGYILIRFIFSSSKVQLGTVLIYLVVFMLIGKISAFFFEGFLMHDIIAFILGFITLIGLLYVRRQRKNLFSYDL